MEGGKIAELDVSADDDEFTDCESEDDDVPLRFKQSVLRNKSIFEQQLLDSTEIEPSEIFEVKARQENEGDFKELSCKMDVDVLDLPVDEEEEHKLKKLSSEMTPVPGCDGVFKKIRQPGEGSFPPVDSIVTIHYNGYIQDEISNQVKSFDSTILRGKPKSFMRGQGEVILGLDIAVGTMKCKEEAEFIFSPDFAFGERGSPPRVPANAYVYFKVDLIEWVDSSAAEAYGKLPRNKRKEVSFDKLLEAAKSEKNKATSYFEKQNYMAASKSYRNALMWIEDRGYANEEEEDRGQKLCLKLHLDLALLNLRVNKPKRTCIHCKEALTIDPNNAKALYRFGQAQEKLGDYESARKWFEKAQKILPKDASINRALFDLNAKVRKEAFIEKDLCKKMLGLPSGISEKLVTPVDESHKAIRRQLEEFVHDAKEESLVFHQGLSQSERTFVEAEAARLKLRFARKPLKHGEDIFTVLKSLSES